MVGARPPATPEFSLPASSDREGDGFLALGDVHEAPHEVGDDFAERALGPRPARPPFVVVGRIHRRRGTGDASPIAVVIPCVEHKHLRNEAAGVI